MQGSGLVFHIKTGAFLCRYWGLGEKRILAVSHTSSPGLELRVKQMKGAGAAVVVRSRALIDVEVDRELGEES